jgi:hypothetical protein
MVHLFGIANDGDSGLVGMTRFHDGMRGCGLSLLAQKSKVFKIYLLYEHL